MTRSFVNCASLRLSTPNFANQAILAPPQRQGVLELDPGDAQSDAQPSEQQIENEDFTFRFANRAPYLTT